MRWMVASLALVMAWIFAHRSLLEGLVAGSGISCCPASVMSFDCLLVEEKVVFDDGVIHPCLSGLRVFGRGAEDIGEDAEESVLEALQLS